MPTLVLIKMFAMSVSSIKGKLSNLGIWCELAHSQDMSLHLHLRHNDVTHSRSSYVIPPLGAHKVILSPCTFIDRHICPHKQFSYTMHRIEKDFFQVHIGSSTATGALEVSCHAARSSCRRPPPRISLWFLTTSPASALSHEPLHLYTRPAILKLVVFFLLVFIHLFLFSDVPVNHIAVVCFVLNCPFAKGWERI